MRIQNMTARHGQVQFESSLAHEQEGTEKELGAREAAYAALLVKLKVCSGSSNLLPDSDMPSDHHVSCLRRPCEWGVNTRDSFNSLETKLFSWHVALSPGDARMPRGGLFGRQQHDTGVGERLHHEGEVTCRIFQCTLNPKPSTLNPEHHEGKVRCAILATWALLSRFLAPSRFRSRFVVTRREYMEDTFAIHHPPKRPAGSGSGEGEEPALFGLFDGHGGNQ
jgi:hypothetical protein